jgi:hypothetical protein
VGVDRDRRASDITALNMLLYPLEKTHFDAFSLRRISMNRRGTLKK